MASGGFGGFDPGVEIGFGFFLYGKRQKAIVPLVCGLLLMGFPYFVSNTMVLVAIGALLMAIPCFVRL